MLKAGGRFCVALIVLILLIGIVPYTFAEVLRR